jgi:hypothetical protein
MKNRSRVIFLFLLFFVTLVADGAIPPINVTVSDGSGTVVFKGATSATGTFSTPTLRSGNYVVQFGTTNRAVTGNRYGLVISAGKARVGANGIAGDRFAKGVAMKITVGESTSDTIKKNPSLNNPAAIRALERMEREAQVSITGQVTLESQSAP